MAIATKKQQSIFCEDVTSYIVRRGATKIPSKYSGDSYKMDTKAGELIISLYEPEKSNVFTIFCQFQDVEKAKEVLKDSRRLNKYSGKWNFHQFDADSALTEFHNELKPIL